MHVGSMPEGGLLRSVQSPGRGSKTGLLYSLSRGANTLHLPPPELCSAEPSLASTRQLSPKQPEPEGRKPTQARHRPTPRAALIQAWAYTSTELREKLSPLLELSSQCPGMDLNLEPESIGSWESVKGKKQLASMHWLDATCQTQCSQMPEVSAIGAFLHTHLV